MQFGVWGLKFRVVVVLKSRVYIRGLGFSV